MWLDTLMCSTNTKEGLLKCSAMRVFKGLQVRLKYEHEQLHEPNSSL